MQKIAFISIFWKHQNYQKNAIFCMFFGHKIWNNGRKNPKIYKSHFFTLTHIRNWNKGVGRAGKYSNPIFLPKMQNGPIMIYYRDIYIYIYEVSGAKITPDLAMSGAKKTSNFLKNVGPWKKIRKTSNFFLTPKMVLKWF